MLIGGETKQCSFSPGSLRWTLTDHQTLFSELKCIVGNVGKRFHGVFITPAGSLL